MVEKSATEAAKSKLGIFSGKKNLFSLEMIAAVALVAWLALQVFGIVGQTAYASAVKECAELIPANKTPIANIKNAEGAVVSNTSFSAYPAFDNCLAQKGFVAQK